MSFYALQWARKSAPVADVFERVIVMNMAAVADLDGAGVYLSRKTLAESCMCDEETVKRRLRSMAERGLIALGDQARAAHIEKRYRPPVYDLMIPFRWFSEEQMEEVNKHRAEHGHAPLTESERPPITAAPPRKNRGDKGKPNPRRSPKSSTTPEGEGALSEPPAEPVDNSLRGLCESTLQPVSGGSLRVAEGALQEPQIGSFNKSENSPSVSLRNAGASDEPARTDGRTENPPAFEASGGADSTAAALLADAEIAEHLARVDMRPEQFRRLEIAADAALLRFSPARVARYLHDKARDAQTAMYVVRAFELYADAIVMVGEPGTAAARRTDAKLLEDLAATKSAPERPRGPAPDCRECGGDGWTLGTDGAPLEPARRCRCVSAAG